MDSTWNPWFSEVFTSPATIHIPSNNQPAWLQPQPQSDAAAPPGSERTEAKKFTAGDWETHEQEITRLYDENSLASIMKLMKERHGLEATRKQYLNKLKKWGLNKNVQPDEMKFMIRKQQNRLLESGKPSAFRVRKRPVPPGKISRYMRDHGIEKIRDNDRNMDESTNSMASPIATPGAISYYTPSATGPMTPQATEPMTPHAAECPPASLSPRLSFYNQGHSSQFGDPGPILPSSPWVAQTPRDSHMHISSPMSTAASPAASPSNLVESDEDAFTGQSPSPMSAAPSPAASPSTLLESDEGAFTGQSPAPFPTPSTPQAYRQDVWQDGAMEIVHDSDDAYAPESMLTKAYELESQGSYSAAERMYRLVLQQKESLLGREHQDTIACMASLAHVLEIQGRYRAAEQMERQTLRLSQKVLGPKHPDTLSSIDRLGMIIERQGSYKVAERIIQQALKLKEEVLGPEHPDTLRSMRNVAFVLQSLERYGEAERISKQVLQLMQKVLGPHHLNTLIIMDNHAWVLGQLGRHNEAEQMSMQALKLRQEALGHEHPNTIVSMSSVASILSFQGRYDEAEKMDKQTLELSKKVLGPEHPSTADCLYNLADTLKCQGRYSEALDMCKQALELNKKVRGPEHPYTKSIIVCISAMNEHDGLQAQGGR